MFTSFGILIHIDSASCQASTAAGLARAALGADEVPDST